MRSAAGVRRWAARPKQERISSKPGARQSRARGAKGAYTEVREPAPQGPMPHHAWIRTCAFLFRTPRTLPVFLALMASTAAEPNALGQEPGPEKELQKPPAKSLPAPNLERYQEMFEASERDPPEAPGMEKYGFGAAFFQMLLALGAVCLLAYLLLGKLWPRLLRVSGPHGARRIIHIVDRAAIDQRRSILVVAVGDRYFLVGAADQSLSLLSRLDTEDVETLLARIETSPSPMGRLTSLFLKDPPKEG